MREPSGRREDQGMGLIPVLLVVSVIALVLGLIPPATGRMGGRAAALLLPAGGACAVGASLLVMRRARHDGERLRAAEEALRVAQEERRAALAETGQLQTQNAMLDIVARSLDVGMTFQALAVRIARLVPCDRVGLALLSATGREFETYTARVHEDERRNRPRPDVVFGTESTALGAVVRTLEPLLLDDLARADRELLDLNVLASAGFRSALVVPLVSNGRGVGTLNLVSRQPAAFTRDDVEKVRPIGEILAVAHAAQQLHTLMAKYRAVEAMAEVMLSTAADINSALQTIVGHCELLQRTHGEGALQRDLAIMSRQAERIAGLLERMRAAATERLQEVASSVGASSIPSSPEEYEHERA